MLDAVNSFQQESPPAWTQEAYRPCRTTILVLGGGGEVEGGVPLSWPGRGRVRGVGARGRRSTPVLAREREGEGVGSKGREGYLVLAWNTPPSPPPPPRGQIHTCENITFPHPSDEGGKKTHMHTLLHKHTHTFEQTTHRSTVAPHQSVSLRQSITQLYVVSRATVTVAHEKRREGKRDLSSRWNLLWEKIRSQRGYMFVVCM